MIAEGDQGVRFGPAHALAIPSGDVMTFYETNWSRRISLSLPKFYMWQFVGAPESQGLDWNCLAVRDGQILGVMGLNPRSFHLRGKHVHAAELTTWVVGEAARGLGVGRGIMRSIQESYDLAFGFGISDAAMPIYTTSGYRRLKQIPRYFRIYDVDSVRPHAQIAQLGQRLAEQWDQGPRSPVVATPVEARSLGDLGREMQKSHNLYVRDEDHLAWRYDRHPVFRYEAFSIASKAHSIARIGVVVRRDHVEGLRFMHVLDILGDEDNIPLALSFIDEFARANDLDFVDFYCTSTAVTRHCLAGGWFSTNDDDYFQLSHLYYPSEFRTPQTTSMVYWSRDHMAELADLGRMYLTKEDLDLDRPTRAFYDVHGIEQE